MTRVATHGLFNVASHLLERPDATTSGWWPRAAALLARQALEQALREYWDRKCPGMANASARAQFLCLREYIDDEELAGAAYHTWQALSEACHHHPYQLSPTSTELRRWLDTARLAVAELEK